ncbi:SafA/ExsA family spore coat assembly protein [Jeotgalibacillus aurantiacus]|uniref:SafA/ExsA family spore coat assembly protein n=1 Tax=Jeotgalibacillus aurantiacus TaxID=2763266 RepID=UPI003872BC82
MKIHIVQKGDTLWNISKQYNVPFDQLKAANTQLANPDMIMPGMKIKVPSAAAKKELKMEMTHPYAEVKPAYPEMKEQMQYPVYTQPEIDLHQTYNIHMQQLAGQMPSFMMPAPPPFPAPVQAPEMVSDKVKEEMEEEPMVMGVQEMPGGYPGNCWPISPVMPGSGLDCPMPYGVPFSPMMGPPQMEMPQMQEVAGVQQQPPFNAQMPMQEAAQMQMMPYQNAPMMMPPQGQMMPPHHYCQCGCNKPHQGMPYPMPFRGY